MFMDVQYGAFDGNNQIYHQKHSSWQLYSNDKNGLLQIQMESCHSIKRLGDKKKNQIEQICIYTEEEQSDAFWTFLNQVAH